MSYTKNTLTEQGYFEPSEEELQQLQEEERMVQEAVKIDQILKDDYES